MFGLVDKITSIVAAIATSFRFLLFDETNGEFVLTVQDFTEQRILIGLKGGVEQALSTWIDGAMIATGNNFENVRSRRVLVAIASTWRHPTCLRN